jgi:hypothetical protein
MKDDKHYNLLARAFEWEAGIPKKRASINAAYFSTLNKFLKADAATLGRLASTSTPWNSRLSVQQLSSIRELQKSRILSLRRSIADNLLILTARRFVKTQIKMLDGLTLDDLSPNPFLIQCLNLKTPREVVELNVFMFATRSIVTSMGFLVETLLEASSDSVSKGKKPWDLLVTRRRKQRHWIQVKSGPNDMDADQIRHWKKLFSNRERGRDKAYIGVTYGKRSTISVTMGLFKTYLPKWNRRTLIGRELWDFVSEDPRYHLRLFPLLSEAASQILKSDSIEKRIAKSVNRLTLEFSRRYKPKNQAVGKYLKAIF